MGQKISWFLIFVYLLLISANGIMVRAEELNSRMTIELAFPKKSTAKMVAPMPKMEPTVVSGLVRIDLTPAPASLEQDRYTVEYFLDEELLHQTTGINKEDPASTSFGYTLDTKRFANGPHKLIVNFWDASGPSAIGIREIIINNSRDEQ